MAILTYNGRPLDCGDYLPPFSYTRKIMQDGPSAYGRYIWHSMNGTCIINTPSICKRFSASDNKWTSISSSQSAYGSNMWSDGSHDYYSRGSTQYTVSYSGLGGLQFGSKTWTGLTDFYGANVWSDGTNIYVSDDWNVTYVLNTSNSSWTVKTWNGFNEIDGANVWSDGTDYYYSSGSKQYVLDRSTDTWYQKTWNGGTDISGYNIWKLGEQIYCSLGSKHYAIYPATSSYKRAYCDLEFLGQDVWTHQGITYVSNTSNGITYILSESTLNNNNFISYETT